MVKQRLMKLRSDRQRKNNIKTFIVLKEDGRVREIWNTTVKMNDALN